METEVELKHRHMISICASDAARYFAMHAANRSDTWRDAGIERLQNIARMLDYDFAPRKPLQETEVNDDLITLAARDLFKALKAVMEEYRDGYGLNCVEQVRAAIAKAEGES